MQLCIQLWSSIFETSCCTTEFHNEQKNVNCGKKSFVEKMMYNGRKN